MKIVFGLHAKNQFKERRISRKLVRKILQNPDSVLDGKNGRKIAQKIVLEGKFKFLYRVIFEMESKNNFLVVTAYKTSNIKRYLVKK